MSTASKNPPAPKAPVKSAGKVAKRDENKLISEAMRALGSRRSPRKTAAARTNAAKARAGRGAEVSKPLLELPCTCSAEPSSRDHAARCPRGRAIRRRVKADIPLVWSRDE